VIGKEFDQSHEAKHPWRGVISSHSIREWPLPKRKIRPPCAMRLMHSSAACWMTSDWVCLSFSSKAMVRSKYCDAALGPSWEGVPEEARFSMESSPSQDKFVVLMHMSGC
jgi:hypothetical protein